MFNAEQGALSFVVTGHRSLKFFLAAAQSKAKDNCKAVKGTGRGTGRRRRKLRDVSYGQVCLQVSQAPQ